MTGVNPDLVTANLVLAAAPSAHDRLLPSTRIFIASGGEPTIKFARHDGASRHKVTELIQRKESRQRRTYVENQPDSSFSRIAAGIGIECDRADVEPGQIVTADFSGDCQHLDRNLDSLGGCQKETVLVALIQRPDRNLITKALNAWRRALWHLCNRHSDSPSVARLADEGGSHNG